LRSNLSSRYALSEKAGRRPRLFPFLVKW